MINLQLVARALFRKEDDPKAKILMTALHEAEMSIIS